MNAALRFLRRLWQADTFSPTAFIVRAVIISTLYTISRLAGLQEYTAFLSGTSPSDLSWQMASMLGLLHLLLHVAFILLVPISLFTAGLLFAGNRFTTKSLAKIQ